MPTPTEIRLKKESKTLIVSFDDDSEFEEYKCEQYDFDEEVDRFDGKPTRHPDDATVHSDDAEDGLAFKTAIEDLSRRGHDFSGEKTISHILQYPSAQGSDFLKLGTVFRKQESYPRSKKAMYYALAGHAFSMICRTKQATEAFGRTKYWHASKTKRRVARLDLDRFQCRLEGCLWC